MDIKVNSIKFKTDAKLEAFIKEKVEKLNKHYDNILSSDIILKIENNGPENKIAEV